MGNNLSHLELNNMLNDTNKKIIIIKNEIKILEEVFAESFFKIYKYGATECDYSNVDWNRIEESKKILKKYDIIVNKYWSIEKNNKICNSIECEENKMLYVSKLSNKLLEKKIH
jgi:hypothetical protein